MFETTPDTRHRDAIRAAHDARGQAFAEFWHSLFPRRH